MIAAVQSIPSLEAAWSGISPKNVEAFLGAFGHVCVCKIDEVKTTGAWVEQRFGVSEKDRPTCSETVSVDAKGERSAFSGFSYTRETATLIRSTQIEELPLTGPKNPVIRGACHMDLGGPVNFWTHRTFAQLSRTTPRPSASQMRWNFIEVDEGAAKLKPWNDEERERLGLSVPWGGADQPRQVAEQTLGKADSPQATPMDAADPAGDLDFR
jgi:hypothetical protein